MFLFSFSVLTLCLAFIFQTALGVELPDPPYDGLWMELNYDRKYMIGYISKDTVKGFLEPRQLATIAYRAGMELKRHLEHDKKLLSSNRQATTVSVWQDGSANIYIASSDGTYKFEGHAEANIIKSALESTPNEPIRGGRVVSYTTDGSMAGIRPSCDQCKTEYLKKHHAEDAVEINLRPDPPVLPSGWNSEWSVPYGAFTYGSIYDCQRPRQRNEPRAEHPQPNIPEGWNMVWSNRRNAYTYEGIEDRRVQSIGLPTGPPARIGGQGGQGRGRGHKSREIRRSPVGPKAIPSTSPTTPKDVAEDTCSGKVIDGPPGKPIRKPEILSIADLKAKAAKTTPKPGKVPPQNPVATGSSTGAKGASATSTPAKNGRPVPKGSEGTAKAARGNSGTNATPASDKGVGLTLGRRAISSRL